MPSHASRALYQARLINSKRLYVLMFCVGVLCVVRLVVYPVPDAAFVLFGVWMLAGLLYDLGMKKIARIVPAGAMQVMMYALDITLLTAVVAVA